MPSWKKIILSGSDAALNTLSVSNSITASVISASQFTGSLFGTSSWATRAVSSSYFRGITAIVTNLTINNSVTWSVDNPNSILGFDSNGGLVSGIPRISWYQESSSFPSLRVGTLDPEYESPQTSGSHILKDGRELFTNARAIEDGEPFTVLGFAAGPSITLDENHTYKAYPPPSSGYIPGNVYAGSLTLGASNLYGINVDNGTSTNLINKGSIVVLPSSPGLLMGQGGFYIFESASMKFNASGALLSPVASASVRFTLSSDSSSLSISVGKNDLREILFISRSGNSPRIGVGKSTPNAALDIIGSIIITGSLTASGDLNIKGFPSVSASLASLASGVGTLQQVTDAGNTTSNAISSSFNGVGFFGTASWAINVVNGGGGGSGGSDSAFLNQSTAATTWSFAHNLGTQYPVITIYDTNGQVIIPQEIDGEDTNNLKIYFPTSQSGYATAVGGTSALTYYSQSLTTASVNLNTITFTKGDSSTFNIVVNTGSVPTLQQVTTQGASTTIPITASIISASSFTGSLFGTASWAVSASRAITASHALTASSADNFIVRNSLTASGLNYPSADNGEFSFIQTDGNGNLSLQYVNTLYEIVYNGEATQLDKGTPVYISGSQGANSIAYRADAGNPSKMPVVYVVADNIASADTGRAIALGLITGVDTTGYPGGTEIYVGVGGGWTSTRPTGSAIVQVLGYVTKEGAGGQGVVLNPGPANLPNLPSGSVWLGNSGSVPIAVSSASLFVNSASFASTASFVRNAQTASKISVVDDEATNNNYALTFADPTIGDGVQLKSDASTLVYNPFLGTVFIGDETSLLGLKSSEISTLGISTFTFLNTNNQVVDFGSNVGSTLNIRYTNTNFINPITASIISASSFTGSLQGTSSWATNALTASNITPAITNNTDNRVLTATGAGSINGEANLTFDGSLLDVIGDIQFNENRIRTSSTTVGQPGKGADLAYDWAVAGGPTLTAGRIVYLSGSTQWAQAQANVSGSSYGMLGVVTNAASQNEILIEGIITISGSALSSGIAGQPIYLSAATAGQVTLTAPTASNNVVRIIGYITKANSNQMYFNPDSTYTVII